uniref:Uncharacterized protein n=1 Tax=Ananas comosus var. bracteatus TaxID=296719 RepID=A0A6V7P2X8_ANACO|nr:unnamed protein product [Ananas comosus var. bracteatus]
MLHEKISEKAHNDEDVIRILTTRSKTQLIATLNHYNNEFGNPVNKDLKSDPNDEFLTALRATIKCICCPEKYFEKVIRLAINKDGDGRTRPLSSDSYPGRGGPESDKRGLLQEKQRGFGPRHREGHSWRL